MGTERVTILHEGTSYDPFDPYDLWDEREGVDESMQATRDQIVSRGQIHMPNGVVMPEAAAKRVRSRLLGRSSPIPDTRSPGGPRRSLITGLWSWGTIPMLGGPPKAGKTTLVADLVASLLMPGRRFLNHFEPADLSADKRHLRLYVVLINAETPAADFEDALRSAGVDPADDWLQVIHLERLGGPQLMDVTHPDVYEQWADWLMECETCEGTDYWSASVVIVDGLTAILGGTTERYGQWYAAFRRLMREIDVPNALVVGHNTLAGDHLMGGVEAQAGADGLWNYTRSKSGRRAFSLVPRVGGVAIDPTPVLIGNDGRLCFSPTSRPLGRAPEGREETVETQEPGASTADALVAYVRRCAESGYGPSARDLRENVPGPNPEVDAERDRLVADGTLVKRPRKGRGGGDSYWPA